MRVGPRTTEVAPRPGQPLAHDETGVKHFHHPAVGDLVLDFDAMSLSAGADLTMTAYTAEVGSPSHDGPRLLATWAATRSDVDIEVPNAIV